jgi:hypothetical protein
MFFSLTNVKISLKILIGKEEKKHISQKLFGKRTVMAIFCLKFYQTMISVQV